MTVTVSTPDGSSFDFPDGTPQDEITQALDTHFGSQVAAPNPDAKVPLGIAESLGSGIVKGGAELAGLPGDAKALVDKGLSKILPTPAPQSPQAPATGWYGNLVSGLESARSDLELPTSEQTLNAVKQVVPLHEPETTPEKYASTVGEFVPGALAAPGESLVGKLAQYAVAPGLASEGAGEATAGTAAEAPARIAASFASPGIARKLITPFGSSPEQQAMVSALRSEGVQPTAGQATGSPWLKYWEGDLNPGRNDEQAEQFTQAALNRIGINEPRATIGPNGNVTQAADRIGQNFDDLSTRNNLVPDQQLAQGLRDTHSEYNSVPGLYPAETTNAVNGAINRIASVFNTSAGTMMSGADYQSLRSQINKAAMGSSNPQTASGLRDVVENLDDAMERSIAATNPNDSGAWGQARRDYRNLLVIEKARGAAGEGAAQGLISPAQLASAAKSVYGKRAYQRGYDDFSNLAEPGVGVMTPLPDSGTSQRTRINDLIHGATAFGGAGIGAGIGSMSGGGANEGGVLGLLLGGAGAPYLEPVVRGAINKGLMSAPMQRGYLPNNVLPKTPMSQDAAKQLLMAKMLMQPQSPQAQAPAAPTQ
jgi:hypothetical protein